PAELLVQGGSLSLLDLAQAYSVFANLGTLVGVPGTNPGELTPVTVLAMEDAFGGQVQDDQQLQRRSVLSPDLAYLVHHVLADEHARWLSLGYPNPLEVGRPVGAKVGQAAGGLQVWSVGYTPQRLALVWLGFPQAMADAPRLQPRQAAGIWHAIIQYASRDLPPAGWQPPPGISAVKVCDPSGKLPTAACPLTVDEVFLRGNEPVEYDSLYRALQINRETGRLATVFTPLELIKEEVFLTVPAEALEWARAAGLPLPPAEYDDILAPPTLPDVNITEPPIFSTVNGRVTLIGTAAGEGFTSYRLQVGEGLNPRAWRQIDQEITSPVKAGQLGVWDTRDFKDGLYSLRLTVLRADQRLDTAVTQLAVDNTPPVVQVLAYPLERQITFRAEISDQLEIQRVRWWLNGRQIGESSQSPFSFSWTGSPGSYTLVAEAVDLAGNAGKSQPVPFTLEP
ncbi:MAG: Ig-like domain-containing protein, partial [Anaerolineaceae bacterium]|nr:Ig-like domain-containing protein [Anaerolineaceae bacterium]